MCALPTACGCCRCFVQSHLAPASVDLLLQIPDTYAEAAGETTWESVGSAVVSKRATVTRLSGHGVLATGAQLRFHGRRADNKLNVVAVGKVAVTTPNPCAVYSSSLDVLSSLQQWLYGVALKHRTVWPDAMATSLRLALCTGSLSALLRVSLNLLALDGCECVDVDAVAVSTDVWSEPLPATLSESVTWATQALKVVPHVASVLGPTPLPPPLIRSLLGC